MGSVIVIESIKDDCRRKNPNGCDRMLGVPSCSWFYTFNVFLFQTEVYLTILLLLIGYNLQTRHSSGDDSRNEYT